MRTLKSTALIAAALAALAAPAFAGVEGSISVAVKPILDPAVATYTDPATGFQGTVGYQVDLQSAGKNTSNSVRFTAQANVTDAAEFGTFEFVSSEGLNCSATRGPVFINLDCAIGTLTSGQVVPTFYLFFKSPVFVPNGTADDAGTDAVNFNYQVFYAEGGNGPKSTPKNGFTTLTAATPVVLGTRNPQVVRSVVLATGGTFFTGDQGIAVPTDEHATKSVVPALTAHTTAEIIETGLACSSPNVVTCYTSKITIPGSFPVAPYLTSRITQAIQNIRTQTVTVTVPCYYDDDDDKYRTSSTSSYSYPKTCTKTTTQRVPIEQVVVTYLADVTAANPNPMEQVVGLCSPLAGPPPVGVPCITNRTVVNDALGNPIRYEWTFISFQNGLLKIN